jgi:transposase
MLYLGIDQHKHHLTICVRDVQGNVVLRRQVSTSWKEVDEFLAYLQSLSLQHGGYVAVMEVCGFNGWLIKRLKEFGCQRVIVITPPERVRQKTDRRDAAKLSQLLWLNRGRITAGEPLLDVSEVYQASEREQADRQLTRLRHRLGQRLTRVKNSIGHILRRYNLEQECPTKGLFTKKGLGWLQEVALPEVDRLEMKVALAQYQLLVMQLDTVNRQIAQRATEHERVPLLRSVSRVSDYTALALAAHIGPIERFERPRSLANFFGLTPGCRNSGRKKDRPGSITKAGHPFVRFLLGQMVLHALRTDPGLRKWYRSVKHRRGAKIARVAVMRRLCEAIWHVLKNKQPYQLLSELRDKKAA